MTAIQTAATPSVYPAPLRALILEDSDDDALLLVTHLRRSGYDLFVRRADDAEGCERALTEESWDADALAKPVNLSDLMRVVTRYCG